MAFDKPVEEQEDSVEDALGVALDSLVDSKDLEYKDDENLDEAATKRQRALADLNGFVGDKYRRAKDSRSESENKWLNSYRAHRGEYSPEEKARIAKAQERNPGSSEIFVKITKTKVQAAYGQILEVLFAGNKFPIGIEPTPVPEGIAKSIYLAPPTDPNEGAQENEAQPTGAQPSQPTQDLSSELGFNPEDAYGFAGDGKEIAPGMSTRDLLGGAYDKYKNFLTGKKVVDGPSPDKTQLIQVNPAEEAARAMELVMHDQLAEDATEYALKKATRECVVYGTGVVKGPFNLEETYSEWKLDPETKTMQHKPKKKLVPKFDFVSCWNLYPDPDAEYIEEAEYVVQRHLLSKSQLKNLKKRPFFFSDAIDKVLKQTPYYSREYWEDALHDNHTSVTNERYEVLEYWGYLDDELAISLNLDGKIDNLVYDESVQVNVWVSGGQVLRVVLNPFQPQRIPYYCVPYEEHLHQIWGVGVPENMSDTQALMNGHMRMSIDNLRLAGNVMLEVSEASLVPGQDMSVYPGKIWRKQSATVGQTIYGIQVPNTAPAHIQMFDKARQLADEETGLPSYSHGQTGISGTTRTAAGMSMLMSAAALNIKTVIKNFDHFLLKPMGQALFDWNMQFNSQNLNIRGDLKIVAKGTSSLMQREVLTQRLLSLIQVASNPIMAPFLNAEYVFREIAINMDLDPDKVVNDPKIAALYAQLVGAQNGGGQGAGAQAQGAGGIPGESGSMEQSDGGVDPSDTSGGGVGNIGVGSAPMPGEAGFSQ